MKTANAEEIPVVVKTYYDEVDNFAFDTSDNSISFDMPFDWSPDYVDLVQVVLEELEFQKHLHHMETENNSKDTLMV